MTRTFYIHRNWAGSILVKDGELFFNQGGLAEEWGKGWLRIQANTLRDAYEQAKEHFARVDRLRQSSAMPGDLEDRATQLKRIESVLTIPSAGHASAEELAETILDALEVPKDSLMENGADAMMWAKSFVATIKSPHFEVPNLWDEGFMVGWFANAIEAARMVDRSKQRLYQDVVEYIYGKNDSLTWRRIIEERMVPPLPLPEHLKSQGLDCESKDQQAFKRGYEAGLADGKRENDLLKSAWQPWVHTLSIMQQSVLASAVRAPDGMKKFHPAKMIVRWYRRCVLVSAFDGRALLNPHEEGGGSFTGPLQSYVTLDRALDEFMVARDEMSLHYYAHMMHAAQIVGYYHPEEHVQEFWNKAYNRMVNALHLSPESYMAMAQRLSDNPQKWEARSDEAAACTD